MKIMDFMKFSILIFLALLISCHTRQPELPPPTPNPVPLIEVPEDLPPEIAFEEYKTPLPQNKGSVENKFKNYLKSREIKPLLTIENDYDGLRGERVEEIKVSNHKITWFHSMESAELKIDGDLITIKDKLSLNNAHENRKIDGFIVNDWREIKLFNLNGRELIGIEMGNNPCTGLMCSVTFFLIYDLRTKSENFFGDFRIDNELKLYDFGNNRTIDFLGTNNDFSYSRGIEITHIYNLYALGPKGYFRLQKNSRQRPFFIKRVFSSDNHEEVEDKFKQNWIEKIN